MWLPRAPVDSQALLVVPASIDSGSSSSASSSDDGSCVSSEEDKPATRSRQEDPAAVKLQKSLMPFFQKMRAVVSYYKHNSDDFVILQNDCKSTKILRKAYASETPTRWSSCLMSLTP